MHPAGAPTIRHAPRLLLGGGLLVAMLALVLAATPAAAQVAAPPGPPVPGPTAPGLPAGDQAPGDDWGDDSYEEPDTPTVLPLQPPAGLIPGGADAWEIPLEDELPAVTSTSVTGRVARMRADGRAAIPRGAPKRVRSLIAQYNRIVGKRYKWGGGHARLVDSGYDCSGAVGYGLIRGGLLGGTMVSGSFARWGAAGAGRWVTVYAHKAHVYVEIAGLRLDTSPAGDRSGRRGVHWRPAIGQRRGFKARHPVGL